MGVQDSIVIKPEGPVETQRDNFQMKIRSPAKFHIYKNALRRDLVGTFGFLIGEDADSLSPVVDMSLHSITISDPREIFDVPGILEQDFQAAGEVAKYAEAKVIGIYMALSDDRYPDRINMVIGLLLDGATKMKLEYLVYCPTCGGETFWGIHVYSTVRCFESCLRSSTAERKSCAMNQNPRRILSLWSRLRTKRD